MAIAVWVPDTGTTCTPRSTRRPVWVTDTARETHRRCGRWSQRANAGSQEDLKPRGRSPRHLGLVSITVREQKDAQIRTATRGSRMRVLITPDKLRKDKAAS
jgi:hypothetical protein